MCFSLEGRTVSVFILKNSCMHPTCAVPACKDTWHSPTSAVNHWTKIIQMVSLQPLMWKFRAKLTYKKASHSAGANYQITINYQITNVQEQQMRSMLPQPLHFVLVLLLRWPDPTAQMQLLLDELLGRRVKACGHPACHRTLEWNGSLQIIMSDSLARQGHLEQVTQECVWVGLEHLQRGRPHTLPGPPSALPLSMERSSSSSWGETSCV